MRKKDILELKKRFKKDHCTFTKMCGCYVNGEKHIILKFRETFLNLEEDEYFKYLEIAKKVLSGTIGNNILELNFPLNEDLVNERQISLMRLKNSRLKDDSILNDFYDSIIKLDESEEVYEYVLCAICPVSLSEPGLRYFEDENKIKARIRDWVVEAPTNGFVFPAFIERSSDVNSIMYYTKNAKDTHPELMETTLGCYSKQTSTIQKEAFQSIIKDSFGADEKKAEKVFMEVQDNLSNMIDEHNAMYEDTDCEPIILTNKDIQNLLIESGVPEEITTKIEKSYVENFGEDLPLAESLLDAKTLKVNEQRKREHHLQKQVEILQTKLDEVAQEADADNETLSTENDSVLDDVSAHDLEDTLDENEDTKSANDDLVSDYDIIVQVKPEKVPQIKSQLIDGQKCIVIPINENEQTTVNGVDDLI